MKPLSITRSAVASAMLALVVVASFLGAACEARCVQPTATHSCCPERAGNHGSVGITSAAVCHHPASVLSVNPVTPVGVIAGLAVFAPLTPAQFRAAFEARPAPVTASPPDFHLRI